jgi:hypothetical protein
MNAAGAELALKKNTEKWSGHDYYFPVCSLTGCGLVPAPVQELDV